jgi:hypothetical protein
MKLNHLNHESTKQLVLALKAQTETNDYLFQTLFSAISVGLLTVALSLAKTGRDALFFQDQGLSQLPMTYMAIGMSSLPAAFLFVRAMKIWGARSARVGIMIFAAAVLAAFSPFLIPGNYLFFKSVFIFIPTIFGLLFASTWLLVSDLFDNAPKIVAATSFSRIGASSLVGRMLGGIHLKGPGSPCRSKMVSPARCSSYPVHHGRGYQNTSNVSDPYCAWEKRKGRKAAWFCRSLFSKVPSYTLANFNDGKPCWLVYRISVLYGSQ